MAPLPWRPSDEATGPADEVGSFWVVSLHLIRDGRTVSHPAQQTVSPALLLFLGAGRRSGRRKGHDVFAVAASTGETVVEPPVWLTFYMIMRFPQRRVKHRAQAEVMGIRMLTLQGATFCQPQRHEGSSEARPKTRVTGCSGAAGDIRRLSRTEQSEANAALDSRPRNHHTSIGR